MRCEQRWGPRPVDLDIVFYGQHDVSSERLTIPHERYAERSFVLAPLADLAAPADDEQQAAATAGQHTAIGVAGAAAEDGVEMEMASVYGRLQEAAAHWGRLGGERVVGSDEIRRVVPVGEQLWQVQQSSVPCLVSRRR
jgi:2-amino-4-hydroxy-6-hydroxymethyldihydropteridine diphosphokinase/dihydropteroate synthase